MKNHKRVIEISLICTFSVLILFIFARSGVVRQLNIHPASAVEPEQTIQPSQTPVSLALNTPKAAVNQVRWPLPTFSPVMEDIPKTAAVNGLNKPQTKYLIKNPVAVTETLLKGSKEYCKYEIRYPQINGLLDLSVQNSIHNTFKDYAESFMKEASLYQKDLKDIRMYYSTSVNYNNILCINIRQSIILSDDHYQRQETFLYELVNGKRIELRDIFIPDTDFPGVVNKAIGQYIFLNNLEEKILKSPFKGIREGQNFELTENSLRILLDKNKEISLIGLVYGPDSINLKFSQFNGLIDIYERYMNPGKEIYQTPAYKKKILRNDFEAKYMHVEYIRDTYRASLNGLMFSGMKNAEFQKKLNEMCSDTAEGQFKKLLPGDLVKVTNDYSHAPYITRSYNVKASYSDILCLQLYEYYFIPDGAKREAQWHVTYNVQTGKKLELKDLFKSSFDWKTAILNRIKSDSEQKDLKLDMNLETAISKADFWFDEEKLYINLKPEEYITKNNVNIFSYTFESLGEENFTIRE